MKLPEFLTEHPYGEIVVTGHRIGLYSIARRYRAGMTAEQIAEEFPTLTVDQVRKVIVFSDENSEEVDRYVEEYRQDLASQEAMYSRPEKWAELRERWKQLYPGKPLPGAER